MAPIGHSIVPLRFRDSFFSDPYFSDSWGTMERQRRQFDRDCEEASQRVFGRSSSPFSSSQTMIDRPHESLADYFKSTSGVNSSSALSGLASNSETDFKTEKDHYKVILDVQQFKPEELCVKTSDDNNTIIIEGKHEEKSEGSSSSGYISRQFTRKYTLPTDVKLDSLQCNLSADGVLQLTAPRTMKSITEGSTNASANVASERSNLASTLNASNNGYNSNYSSKQESSERMTVDGRKLDSGLESEESKYDNYAKWKESRGEEPEIFKTGYDNVDNANFGSTSKTTSSTKATSSSRLASSSNNNDTAGSKYRDIESLHTDNSRLLSSRMRNWDPFLHVLPDFDMVPFWKRRSGAELSKHFVDETKLGIQNDADNFKVLVDVKQFKPEELSVRCTDQFVIVEGKHEEKEDSYGYISRHLTRKYDLPKGVRGDDVQCNLSAAGILEIKAPHPKAKAVEFEPIGRKVPILMGDNAQRAQSKYVSAESIRKEHASSSSSTGAKDIGYNVQPIQREQTRQESVESTMSSSTIGGTNNAAAATSSSTANNRHVTIEELSRSSSNNSNFNDSLLSPLSRQHHINNIGEHVIPITISAK